jgi:hypothetical protein
LASPFSWAWNWNPYRSAKEASTLQHDHVGVVDHADVATAAEVRKSVSEEYLAIEAGESGKKLEEQHAGITQN